MIEVTEATVNDILTTYEVSLATKTIDKLTGLLQALGLVPYELHFNGRAKDTGNYGYGGPGEVYNTAPIDSVVDTWVPPGTPPEAFFF